ncbi:MAG: hypothetical protein ACW980_24160 [Promethearchaeota archaeon]
MQRYYLNDGEIITSREFDLILKYRDRNFIFCSTCHHQVSYELKDGYFHNYKCGNKECEEYRE